MTLQKLLLILSASAAIVACTKPEIENSGTDTPGQEQGESGGEQGNQGSDGTDARLVRIITEYTAGGHNVSDISYDSKGRMNKLTGGMMLGADGSCEIVYDDEALTATATSNDPSWGSLVMELDENGRCTSDGSWKYTYFGGHLVNAKSQNGSGSSWTYTWEDDCLTGVNYNTKASDSIIYDTHDNPFYDCAYDPFCNMDQGAFTAPMCLGFCKMSSKKLFKNYYGTEFAYDFDSNGRLKEVMISSGGEPQAIFYASYSDETLRQPRDEKTEQLPSWLEGDWVITGAVENDEEVPGFQISGWNYSSQDVNISLESAVILYRLSSETLQELPVEVVEGYVKYSAGVLSGAKSEPYDLESQKNAMAYKSGQIHLMEYTGQWKDGLTVNKITDTKFYCKSLEWPYGMMIFEKVTEVSQSSDPIAPPTGEMETVDLGLSVKWATCNLGASSPEECGGYYQWGGTQDVTSTSFYLDWNNCPYHTGSDEMTGWTKYNADSSYGTVDNKKFLEAQDDAACVALGGKWRTPTWNEWGELINNCTWTWVTDYNGKGVAGMIAQSTKEGYTDKFIFFPAAGGRYYDQRYSVGTDGCYWTKNLGYNETQAGRAIIYNQEDPPTFKDGFITGNPRFLGFSIRPVQSEYSGDDQQDNPSGPVAPEPAPVTYALELMASGGGTKTSLDSNNYTYWSTGDEILLTDGKTSMIATVDARYNGERLCQVTVDDNCTFTGPVHALYPASTLGEIGVLGEIMNINLSLNQDGTASNSIYTGVDSEGSCYISLNCQTALLKVNIDSEIIDIESASLELHSATKFSVDSYGSIIPYEPAADPIAINASIKGKNEIYFCVAPGTYYSFTLRMTGSSGTTYKKELSKSGGIFISNGAIASLGTITSSDIESTSPISVHNPFESETEVTMHLYAIYNSLSKFIESQNKQEGYIIHKDFAYLKPSTSSVYDVWQNAYTTIARANTVIEGLTESCPLDESFINNSLAHARAVRAFVYYNINMLWGGVPLITKTYSSTGIEYYPRSSTAEIYDFVLDELDAISSIGIISIQDPSFLTFSSAAISMLYAELELTNGNKVSAKNHLSGLSNYGEGLIFILGASTNTGDSSTDKYHDIYDVSTVALYNKEASDDLQTLAEEWTTSFSSNYGYWATLKRLGKAQEVTGCEAYQLLLPIPSNELMTNPKMTQNPGY